MHRDPTCGAMARYMGRLVGHYTAGGHHDECGHWHSSGLHYDWWGLSVLNEDEHHIQPDNGAAYTVCFDAIMKEVRKVNPTIKGVGPEIAGASGGATSYLMCKPATPSDSSSARSVERWCSQRLSSSTLLQCRLSECVAPFAAEGA